MGVGRAGPHRTLCKLETRRAHWHLQEEALQARELQGMSKVSDLRKLPQSREQDWVRFVDGILERLEGLKATSPPAEGMQSRDLVGSMDSTLSMTMHVKVGESPDRTPEQLVRMAAQHAGVRGFDSHAIDEQLGKLQRRSEWCQQVASVAQKHAAEQDLLLCAETTAGFLNKIVAGDKEKFLQVFGSGDRVRRLQQIFNDTAFSKEHADLTRWHQLEECVNTIAAVVSQNKALQK